MGHSLSIFEIFAAAVALAEGVLAASVKVFEIREGPSTARRHRVDLRGFQIEKGVADPESAVSHVSQGYRSQVRERCGRS